MWKEEEEQKEREKYIILRVEKEEARVVRKREDGGVGDRRRSVLRMSGEGKEMEAVRTLVGRWRAN